MFFEDIDGLKILERNSARLEGVEFGQIRKLIKIYKQARKEIVNKLLITPDNTFTEAKLETTLRQIEQFLILLNEKIKPELKFGFETLQEQGVEDSAKEINSFEKHFNGVTGLMPIDAILESVKPENFLFNQYLASIENYNSDLRIGFQRSLTQSLVQQKTWSQTVYAMESIFPQAEWQLARIVRTELHNIYNSSKMNGFYNIKEEYLPDLKKTLFHPMDSRTGEDSIQVSIENLIVDLDKPFVYNFNGKKRVFQFPPDRPNDRAILIPYRKSYDK